MTLSINSSVLVQINLSEVMEAILHRHLSCRRQFYREEAFLGQQVQRAAE